MHCYVDFINFFRKLQNVEKGSFHSIVSNETVDFQGR